MFGPLAFLSIRSDSLPSVHDGVVVLAGKDLGEGGQLLHVSHRLDDGRLFHGFVRDYECERCENRDNRNDDEKFDQGEGPVAG